MLGFSSLRFFTLFLIFFTGFTALVYEVTWHFYLANLLGSQARSASLVLATFLGGLAIGYNLFGRFSQRRSPRSLVMLCGVLEAAIGVWALAFPWLHDLFWHVQFVTFGRGGGIGTDVVVAAGLVGVPTIMMGASLPLLTQGLSRGVADAASFHAKVYVVNTLGAFAGTVCAGFVLVPWLGLSTTMFFMGIVNCIVGALFVLLSSRLSVLQIPHVERSDSSDVSEGPQGNPRRFVLLAAFSCLAGLISITFQTVLIRVVALSIGASVYAFSMVVSAFVLALALGAWIIAERRFGRISLAYNQVLVVAGLVAVYVIVPFLPYCSHVFRSLLTTQAPNFWVYYAVVFAAICLLIVIPVGAMGATLPLSFKEAADRAELLGHRVGLIYGANTTGCVVGAVVGGYLSLHYLNLDGVLRVCLVGGALLVVMAAYVAQSNGRRGLYVISALCALIPAALEPWPQMALGRGTFRITAANDSTYKGFVAFYKEFMGAQWIEAYKDDPNSTVAVLHSSASAKAILVNGKSDGSTEGGDRVTTTLMAHLPGLLQASSSRRAAVIGFGTGITVGSLARYEEFDQVDILEISSAVKDFAPRFDSYNSDASRNPKVLWQLGDAYRFLMETDNTYAVIASEPSNPWVGGVERLYSREFYDLAKSKLAPGGIYAQWFHTYSISDTTLALVLNTFKASFPHVHVFERGADLVMLGSADVLDKRSLKLMYDRSNRTWIGTELTEIGFPALQKLLLDEVWVPWGGIVGKVPVHTLDKPKLSYWAGHDFFLDSSSDIRKLATLPRYRGWANQSFKDTLLARLFEDSPEKERIKALAMLACDVVDESNFFDRWQQKDELCRQSLVAMVVQGIVPANAQVPAPIVELFRGLSSEQEQKVLFPPIPSEVGRGLDWVANFAGVFVKVDPIELRRFAEPCFALKGESALACRSRLVLALSATGSISEAKEEFERILEDKLPFRNEEYAQSVAYVADVDLTEEQRKRLVLLD
jgi:predicted membrane-bound spermidine synthase